MRCFTFIVSSAMYVMIQRYCYSTAGLPWGPEKRGGGGRGEAYRQKFSTILIRGRSLNEYINLNYKYI